MSTRRRHGGNFTDSLSSFRQTIHSDANSTCSTYKSFSQDSLDITSNNNRCSTVESIILSGNFIPKAEDVSVLRDASDMCQNIDKQCYQMSEPIVEVSTSITPPSKEDCNMLNTAICISIEQNLDSTENPQFMDKENLDNNQVKDPGKLDIPVDTSVAVTPMPGRNTLSQMHILRKQSDTGHQSNVPEAVTDCNINNIHSKMILDIEKPLGSTNVDYKCCESTEMCNGILLKKSVDSDDDQYETYLSMSGEEENDSLTNKANENLNKVQQCSFTEVLSHLIKDLHPTEPIECPKQILNRLSANFTASPKNFTERLITIIEESVTHNDSSTGNSSAVSLSRLTKEFRSMCKFVEDESVPEWPPSPIASCSSNFEGATNSNDTSLNNKEICEETGELLKPPTAQLLSSASVYHTPGSCSTPTKSYKTPLNILKSGSDSTSCVSFNVQNDTFETLEAQCKIMCSNEDQNTQPTTLLPQHISANNSPNMNMKKFLLLCEQQMASLDMSDCDSPRMQSRVGMQSSPDNMSHRSSPKKMQSLQQQLRKKHLERWNSESQNKYTSVPMDISGSPLASGNTTSSTPLRLSHKNDKIDVICKKSPSLHELEESVMLGIAEKRQRCFDTAMAMMRLNSNGETGQAQRGTEMLSEIDAYCKSNNLENSSKEFFNTLISCNNYYNYLEKHKTLINLVRSKEQSIVKCDGDKSIPETCKTKSGYGDKLNEEFCNDKVDNQIHATAPKLSSTPISSPLKQNLQRSQKRSSRPRLFTTPGKSPVNRYHKRKPVLFPNLCKTSAFMTTSTNLKSPVTKELHKFNDKTVKSPVGMYIKGTGTHFVANVPNQINNALRTPEKTIQVTPQKHSKQQPELKPLCNIGGICTKPRLSPKPPIKSSQHTDCQSSDGNIDVEHVAKTCANSLLKHTPQSNHKRSSRPKLFTTPGKTPVSKYQTRKPLLFPNVCKNSSPRMSPRNNLNSPDMKGHYRFNDASVISPVGMYIKGTDTQFIQNVQSKTNDMLLTPEKSKSMSSQKSSRQQCPSKSIINTQEASLKFRLSPRSPTRSSQHVNYENDDMYVPPHKNNQNSDNRLALPKVVYTLPSQIRTESRQGIGKNYVKGLLATTQSKVIIRHEGRIGSVERKKSTEVENELQEILYASTDESIQVEKIATKTNFISKQKL